MPKGKANLRGIYTEIAKEFGVHPNTARWMVLVGKSHKYLKRYNEIAEERLKEFERFEAIQKAVYNG